MYLPMQYYLKLIGGIMKKILFLLISFSLFAHADNNYSDKICGYRLDDITFPLKQDASTGEMLMFTPEAACLLGKNITKYISNGHEITSSSFDKEGDIFYYTVYKGDEKGYDKVSLRAISYKDGKLIINDIFDTDKEKRIDKPEEDLTGLKVSWYDERNSTLYLTTDAWATSKAIHAMKFANNYSSEIIGRRFFTDGDLRTITNNGLTITKISHDENGAYSQSFLYSRGGKKLCQIDTSEILWAMEQPCLATGEVLKDRN